MVSRVSLFRMPPGNRSARTIVVVGGANYDYLAKAETLPAAGQTVQGNLIDDAPGGKGANQAVAAARLGAQVTFIGRVGQDDRGDRVLAAFAREKIDARDVVRDDEAPTGVALVHVDRAGQKQILAVGGANCRMTPNDVHRVAAVIRGAGLLMLQLELPFEVVVAAAQIAQEGDVLVMLDPAPPMQKMPDELLRMVDLIKPNAAEARALTGIAVQDRETAREAARNLLARGVRMAAAVTAGSEGTLLAWRDGEVMLPRLPVKSVDATGAGDAFAAAFSVAFAEGKSVAEAGAFANAAAALATTVVGAQAAMPTREAVVRRMTDGR